MGAKDLLGDKPYVPAAHTNQQNATDHGAADVRGIPARVIELFERLTFKVIDRGFEHYSADAILHQIRWHEHVELGNRDFKCNNNWTAPLARWFMATYPSHAGFFETRERKSEL